MAPSLLKKYNMIAIMASFDIHLHSLLFSAIILGNTAAINDVRNRHWHLAMQIAMDNHLVGISDGFSDAAISCPVPLHLLVVADPPALTQVVLQPEASVYDDDDQSQDDHGNP